MLLLDVYWDIMEKVVIGYVVLGLGFGDIWLVIFGFYCLYSYLSSFEEVVFVFIDCILIDFNFVVNDCNDGGSFWEFVNIGIGVYFYEVGYVLGCLY